MSYVRWSSPVRLPEGVSAMDYYFDREGKYWDIPTSDLYIYEHVGGFYSVNVADNRHTPTEPFIGAEVVDDDGKPAQSGRASADWLAWMDKGREPIDHPDAGQTFEYKTMREVIAKVEELEAAGFLVPDYLLDDLRKEKDAVAADADVEEW